MKFLVTFEKFEAAPFARAASALWVDGFNIDEPFDDGDSCGWAAPGEVGVVVHAPARAREPQVVGSRIARTFAACGVTAQATHLP